MDKMKTATNDFGSMFKKLEVILEEYLVKKAPQLPESWKEVVVRLAPYLTIVGVIFSIPAFLALLGLGTFMAPIGLATGMMAGRLFLGSSYLVSVLFLGAMILLEGLAIPGLFSRSKKGWNFVYWGVLVGVVQNVVSFNVGGLVIGSLLSLYFLFQVRKYYK